MKMDVNWDLKWWKQQLPKLEYLKDTIRIEELVFLLVNGHTIEDICGRFNWTTYEYQERVRRVQYEIGLPFRKKNYTRKKNAILKNLAVWMEAHHLIAMIDHEVVALKRKQDQILEHAQKQIVDLSEGELEEEFQ